MTIEVDGKDVDQIKGVNTQHGDAVVDFDLKKTAERAAAAAASAGAGAPPSACRGTGARDDRRAEG